MFEACIKIDPKQGIPWMTYGDGLFTFGLYEEAINRLLKCEQLQFKNNGEWEFTLSYVYYNIITLVIST